jgi:hypothetical protein
MMPDATEFARPQRICAVVKKEFYKDLHDPCSGQRMMQ